MDIEASALSSGLTIKAFDNSVANGDGTRVFYVNDGKSSQASVLFDGLTLTGGDLNGTAGGGAVLNFENLGIFNCTITGNRTSSFGGGIFADLGTLTIVDSTISANNAESGGGIHALGGIVNISNSTISGNSVTGDGGGIEGVSGITSIINSTISGNSANGHGGGGSIPRYCRFTHDQLLDDHTQYVRPGY